MSPTEAGLLQSSMHKYICPYGSSIEKQLTGGTPWCSPSYSSVRMQPNHGTRLQPLRASIQKFLQNRVLGNHPDPVLMPRGTTQMRSVKSVLLSGSSSAEDPGCCVSTASWHRLVSSQLWWWMLLPLPSRLEGEKNQTQTLSCLLSVQCHFQTKEKELNYIVTEQYWQQQRSGNS